MTDRAGRATALSGPALTWAAVALQAVLLAPLLGGELWGPDEKWYWARAEHLLRTGSFERVPPAVWRDGREADGWPDVHWRPPGMILWTAAAGLAGKTASGTKALLGVAQFVLMVATLLLWAREARRATSRRGDGGSLAALFVFAPWAFAFASGVYPDPVSGVLSALGTLALLRAVHGQPRAGWLAAGAFLLSAATLFRPDYFPIAIAGPLLALFFRRASGGPSIRMRDLVPGAAAVALALGLLSAYRLFCFGDGAPLRQPRFFNEGARRWVETTFLNERERNVYFIWTLAGGAPSVDPLPPAAFRSAPERAEVARALEDARRKGNYGVAEDAVFDRLARERTALSPLRYVLLPRLYATAILLVNPYANQQTVDAAARLPLAPRWAVLGGLLAVKLAVLALAGLAAARAAPRVWRRTPEPEDAGVLFVFSLVVLRVVTLGFGAAVTEHRYVVGVWPLLLYLAAVGAAWRFRPVSPRPSDCAGATDRPAPSTALP